MMILDYLNSIGAAGWFLIAVIVLAVEMLLTSTYLLWIGLAALVVSLIHLGIELPASIDWPLFAILSVVGAFIGVRFYGPRSRVAVDGDELNQGYGYLVGSNTVLVDAAVNGRGPVELAGTRFVVHLANADAAPPGTRVTVVAVHGTDVMVKVMA